MVKEFAAAIAAAEEDNDAYRTFRWPEMPKGQEFRVYRPTVSQLAAAMGAASSRHDLPTRLATIVDFMIEILDEDAQAYVQKRLMDRTDPFGLDQMVDLFEWVVEEWSARPTERPSGSTRSGPSGGQRSRPRTTKRTSSRTG